MLITLYLMIDNEKRTISLNTWTISPPVSPKVNLAMVLTLRGNRGKE